MMDHTDREETDAGTSESAAYETRDVKIRPLAVFIAGLTVVAVATYLVTYGIYHLFSTQAANRDAQSLPASELAQPRVPGEERLPPEPRIQANAAGDMKTLADEEQAVLTTYGWVDREGGVVRVPIEVAMQQVLEQGLPVRQPEDAPPATGTPAPATTPQAPAGSPKVVK